MMRIILERAGHQVDEAANGAEALRSVAAAAPDLLLTDFLMPVMGGNELIRRIRSDPATEAMPILGVTAHGERNSAADVIVDKPFHPGQLVQAVESLLAKAANRK